MWRAVFAMAHADHKVTDEEKAFMEGYLENVPFSDGQKSVLNLDMVEAQDVAAMFAEIINPEDRGQFFQFARELAWCDGDYNEQEQHIKDKLKALQMDDLDLSALEADLKQSRELSEHIREKEEDALEEKTKGLLGLSTMMRKISRVDN